MRQHHGGQQIIATSWRNHTRIATRAHQCAMDQLQSRKLIVIGHSKQSHSIKFSILFRNFAATRRRTSTIVVERLTCCRLPGYARPTSTRVRQCTWSSYQQHGRRCHNHPIRNCIFVCQTILERFTLNTMSFI